MSRRERFTLDAKNALSLAQAAAERRHSPVVGTEHLLLGCLQTDFVKQALSASAVDADTLCQDVEGAVAAVRDDTLPVKDLSVDVKRILEKSAELSRRRDVINSGDLVIVMLREPEPYLAEILENYPQLDLARVSAYVTAHAGSLEVSREKGSKIINLQDYEQMDRKQQRSIPPHLRPKPAPKQESDNEDAIRNLMIGITILGSVAIGGVFAPDVTVALVIVVGGWIISLVLHEFAHALVGYWGGDYTVADKGYLTMNPLKYTHPLLSIGMPLFFLALGGIGLPGGAVYIERHRLRSNIWNSYVSAAGPFATLLCLIVFSAPFWLGVITPERFAENTILWSSLAFLCYIEAFAILINLVPIPPLDGFGIIEPFLPRDLALQMRSLGSIGFLIILIIFIMPDIGGFSIAGEIANSAATITDQVSVERYQISEGFDSFPLLAGRD